MHIELPLKTTPAGTTAVDALPSSASPTSRPYSANIHLKALGALRGIAVGAALWCSQVVLSSAVPERRGPIAKQDIRRTKALLNMPERLLLMPDTPCKAPVLGCYWLLLLGVASEGQRTRL